MRPRLPFSVTIIVLAKSLAHASPSPLHGEALRAARDTFEMFIVDAALVWCAFLFTVAVAGGICAAMRRAARAATVAPARRHSVPIGRAHSPQATARS